MRRVWSLFASWRAAVLLPLSVACSVDTRTTGRERRYASEPLPNTFGFGRAASAAEIQAVDIDIMPDGRGLPPGSGTVASGAQVYAQKCALCHGATGADPIAGSPKIVGREPRDSFPFGRDPKLTKTVGNYWPYATTLFDYLRRAMPLDAPGSLSAEEVYALVAWTLAQNRIIPDTAIMDARTLPAVRMPARDRFVSDARRGGAEVR
jgi:mono/diheme cytochrome c family protein